jgi:cytochrome c-type biogenesis protein CcmE
MSRITTMSAERRLAFAAVLVTCVTGSMAFVGGSTTWQYYLTVDECLAERAALFGKRIRVNGTVAPSSLSISEGRTAATFSLKGGAGTLGVDCRGPLPDNLAEGMQVVVEGELDATGRIRSEQVLTRCASKYQSERPGPAPGSSTTGHGSAR